MFYSHHIEIEIYGTPDNTCPNYEGKFFGSSKQCAGPIDFVTYDS